LTGPVERLRKVWTPNDEIYEIADSLQPGTELDSKVRDLFSRMVKHFGSVELDTTDPNDGYIRWEEISNNGRSFVTVWWVATPEE
jgi:hypothetical protein